MKIIIFSLLIILITGSNLHSHQIELSLEEAKKLAIQNNLHLKVLKKHQEISQKEYELALSLKKPKIEISETFGITNNPAYVFTYKLNQEKFTSKDFDIGSLNNPDSRSNWNTSITIKQPIFNAGREFIYPLITQKKIDISENYYNLGKNEIIFQVEAVYLGALLSKTLIEVLESTKNFNSENYKVAKSRHEAGLALKSDVLAAEVELNKIEKELIKAKNDYKVTLNRLNYLLGFEQVKEILLKEIEYELNNLNMVCSEENQCLNLAKEHRNELKIKQLELEIARQQKREAKLDLFPNLNLQATYNLNSQDPLKSDGTSWNIILSSSFNLYSGGEKQAKLQSTILQEKKIQIEYNDLIEKITLEIKETLSEIETNRKQIQLMEKNLKHAEETTKILRERYKNGLALIIELLSSESSLKEAKMLFHKAIYDYRLSLLKLKLVTGKID